MPDDFLPPPPLLAAFLVASLVLAVTPGPGVLYILARSLGQGRRAGLASVAGVALGNFANAAGASLGLAAVFAASAVAFTVVKYAGAAYLVYLGVRTIAAARAERAAERAGVAPEPGTPAIPPRLRANPAAGARRVFREGFVVALLNPKTAMFFAAFLPQFMTPEGGAAVQSVLLGGMFVAIAATTDTVYALAASGIAPVFARARGARAAGRYFGGATFIGLGLYTAMSGARAQR